MDWISLLTTAITTIIASGGAVITFFLFFKERKKKEKHEVISTDASAAQNMLDFTDKYQNFIKDIVDKYQNAIKDNREEIDKLRSQVLEHTDKINEIKKVLNNEYGRRRYAEKNICLVRDCKLRVPELDSFKSEEDDIDLKELLNK